MTTSPSTRPNVLLFIPHDTGDFVGCYGHPDLRTPHLDRLAEAGARFTSCFTTAPECTPSRAGLYTGLYTHQTGLMGLCHRGWEFDRGVKHLAQRLWDHGYQTCLFGMNHETGASPARLGYDHVFSQQTLHDTARVCADAAGWIERDAPRLEQPWFACVGIHDTHRPWPPATDVAAADVHVPPYLPDDPAVRADLAEMYQAIENMDRGIGKVLEALTRSAAADRTIVIYTADHGIPFPRAKATYFDAGIRVPLIMHWPGRIDGGNTYNQLLSNLDFTPTLLELCGADAPEGLEGRSFAALLDGQPYKAREAVFGALYYDAFYDPMHCVRTRTHKYIRSFAVTEQDARGADPQVLARHETGTWIRADDSDVQRSPTWHVIRREGPFPPPPAEELYDLEADPLEQDNKATDPACAAVLANLRGKLRDMMERTDSPLLRGHVPPDLSSTRNARI